DEPGAAPPAASAGRARAGAGGGGRSLRCAALRRAADPTAPRARLPRLGDLPEHAVEGALPRLPHRLDRWAAPADRTAGADEADRGARYQPAGAVGGVGVPRPWTAGGARRAAAAGLPPAPRRHAGRYRALLCRDADL